LGVYSRVLNRLLIPLHNTVRRRQYSRHRAFLEQSQWWPPERLREFQWRELQKLLRHAFTTVPYYRQKYSEAGISFDDVRSWEDFSRLPPLTRQEVDRFRQELCSTEYRGALVPDATGGSSGVPTRFFITFESYDWRTAATQRAYGWSGCDLGERTLYLWGAPVGKQTFWRRKKLDLFHKIRRELVINTFAQTEWFWDQVWLQAKAFRPRFILGYVTSLEQFLAYARRHEARLQGLRAVLAAAEPVYDELRNMTQDILGVPLFNTYGCREFMSIAAECEQHQGLHVNAENILLETKQPASLGPSEFLVTDLHNWGMPFIRYEIGDVGICDPHPCVCGRGLPRIGAIEGRITDVLRAEDGRIVPGIFFPHVAKDVPEISQFQVEQKSLAHIVFSVVLNRPLSEKSRSLLETECTKAFGDRTRLEIREVESIPLRPSGKRRVTIGLAQHN